MHFETTHLSAKILLVSAGEVVKGYPVQEAALGYPFYGHRQLFSWLELGGAVLNGKVYGGH